MRDDNEYFIKLELKRLRDHEIKYDYKPYGSKWLAGVKLTNGKMLLICPYRRKVTYRNKTYKYKYLEKWLIKNGLEVAL